VHSDVAHVFCEPTFLRTGSPPATGDAAITQLPGVLLSVQVADCVPILLADTRRRVVAAVHAGWRGTLARIAAKTLGRMQQEFGTRPQDVVAALGPAIGRCCYQVGPEVAQQFGAQFPAAADWFDGPFARLAEGEDQNWLPWLTMMPPGHLPEPERVHLDLRAANRFQLLEAGVPAKHIAVSTLCTYCRADLFFSYRREGAGTGRLLALIGIRKGGARRAARTPRKKRAKAAARQRKHSRATR
jgi:YfiH family protein